jgi:hypothetical protein
MAANEHLNHEQLQMFMPARELMNVPAGDSWPIIDMGRNAYPDGLKFLKTMSEDKGTYEQKLRNAPKRGLPESIKEKGVEDPVSITHIKQFPYKLIADGHHRIAVAHSINPNMEIPVQHFSSTFWDEK